MGAIFVSGGEKKKERPLSVTLGPDLTVHKRISQLRGFLLARCISQHLLRIISYAYYIFASLNLNFFIVRKFRRKDDRQLFYIKRLF